jgi:glycosyltransferase involved in cell wall biosynthesis
MFENPVTVSIIIPCFNAERTLRETVESALQQDGVSSEVIVVDDGSTDNSRDIMNAFGSAITTVTGKNEGAGAARNIGLRMATGTHIQYLDADDILIPGALRRRVDALESENGDVACSDWQRFEETTSGCYVRTDICRGRVEEIHDDSIAATIKGFWAPPAAILYGREIVARVGPWRTDLPIIQDARYMQCAAIAGARFVHVPGVGALYRVAQSLSLSRRNDEAFVRDVHMNSVQIQGLLEDGQMLNAVRAQALADSFDYVSRTLFDHDIEAFRDCVERIRQLGSRDRNRWPRIAGLLVDTVGPGIARPAINILNVLRERSRAILD